MGNIKYPMGASLFLVDLGPDYNITDFNLRKTSFVGKDGNDWGSSSLGAYNYEYDFGFSIG